MTDIVARNLFLPGAGANASFWRPLATHAGLDGVFFSWPGLGTEPPRHDIGSIDDLMAMVARAMTAPVNILAQSMGGIIALRLALNYPGLVRSVVLAATSGGMPMQDHGASDWREEYFATFPSAGRWIADPVPDLSGRMHEITAPVLLLWGDADPISPVSVGKRLRDRVPDARLEVVRGGDHDLVQTHAEHLAPIVRQHLLNRS